VAGCKGKIGRMADTALEHKFIRDQKSDKATYIVKALHKITDGQAREAFENYTAKHLRMSDKAEVITIRFEEWV
jgi:hypothetical protein